VAPARTFLWVGAAIAALVLLAPALLGGVYYRRQTEYRPPSPDGPVEIHVQNTARSSWGTREFVGGDVYAGPFDLYLSAETEDAEGDAVMVLESLTVSDGANELRRAGPVEVPLDPAVRMQGGAETPMRWATFVLRDAAPGAPPRLTLRAKGRLVTRVGTKPFEVAHTVERADEVVLSVGSRDFTVD
jgi:hypothetical protein